MRGKLLLSSRQCLFSFFLFLWLLPSLVFSQVFPDPATVLADLDVSVNVTFNPFNGVYQYAYTLTSGPVNLREIIGFSVDIKTQNPITPGIDPDLINDERFLLKNFSSTRSVPVGLQSPPGWLAGVGILGNVGWISIGAPSLVFPANPSLFPGNSLEGLIIQSKSPPGLRSYVITPNVSDLYVGFGEEIEFMDVPQVLDYSVNGQAIGPVLDEELVRIDGKSQNAIRNAFLSYSNPTTIGTTLAPGVNIFDLVVFLGPTTDPMTFTAELNGVVITNKFTVFAGSASVVRLDLVAGNNVLILTVEGVRPSGATGRDTDKFTFTVTP